MDKLIHRGRTRRRGLALAVVLQSFDAATMTWSASLALPGSDGVSGSNLGSVV